MSRSPLHVTCERVISNAFIQAYLTLFEIFTYWHDWHVLFGYSSGTCQVWECTSVSASDCILNKMHKVWVMSHQNLILISIFLCVYTKMGLLMPDIDCVCVCWTSICSALTALSHLGTELSSSPGYNSNWLNLSGKLRGWLKAPSNYFTVAKPSVKNRFLLSASVL